MSSGQIRLNTATGEWVIYAPTRRKRPQELCRQSQQYPSLHHPCPFCDNGNYSDPIIFELPNPAKTGWQTRSIPNKYPILMPCGNTERISQGIYLSMQGYGRHEVIIESPDHDQTPAKYLDIKKDCYVNKCNCDRLSTKNSKYVLISGTSKAIATADKSEA